MEPPETDPLPPSAGVVDESSLVPVGRDRRFLVRLVLLALVALVASSFVALKLQRAAGSCGASLIRPGATVIPAQDQSSQRRP